MKIKAKLLSLAILCVPTVAWSANDYSLEYSTIDLSGGYVAGAVNTVEDILGSDIQGCGTTNLAYNITSVLCWPTPVSSASNWTVYK